jgi:anti-anti-sigma regulatory factor
MNVKIDTKEKFSVITPKESSITANMTEDIQRLAGYATIERPHLVLNLENVNLIDPPCAVHISDLQQRSYEADRSFVVCCMQPAVEKVFEDAELMELMNITPTESEAWDILHMEEIERELMNDTGGDETQIP